MNKKKKEMENKKAKYSKLVLTKHKKLKEITAGTSPGTGLGCTKSFI